jgi:DNA-binding winged helix-turn-helix (wHTH) protein/predicted ATPase
MTSNKPKRIIFRPFQLDYADQRLFRDDDVVPLRPKPFEVLQYLSQRPGKLVTKDEILAAVWPDTTVTDTVLKVCIREIREALGDDSASPCFIETSHRRGYRFIAKIEQTDQNDEPINSRREQGPVSIESPPRFRESDVVGRDDEIARLEDFLDKSLEGKRQLVFVTGEPGIGKTTLVETFLHRISYVPKILIARGQCLEQYGASEAYMPILEAVSRFCRQSHGDDTLAVLRAHAPTLLAQIPWLIRDQERQALQLETVGATRARMLRETAEAFEALSASKPLVLVIEDLHWSDYSTLDLVSYLARRSEPARLMVVGTYRPAEVISSGHPLSSVKRELQVHRLCEELALRFLNEASVAGYLAVRFPSHRFPAALAHFIHQRTDGNPLFIINLVDFFLSNGTITQEGGEWRLGDALTPAKTGMPDNVRQMIEKQIDTLTKGEQRLLEAASIAGVEFSTATVSSALDIDLLKAEEGFESLARRHMFLRPAASGESPDDETSARYGFIHALYQSELYKRVPSARRAHLHLRIGEHIETAFADRAAGIAAELAMHFEKGRDYRRAVFYLQHAAENAEHRFANNETVELARRGLKLVEKLPREPEHMKQAIQLQTSFAVALAATHGYGFVEVERAYSRARELCQQSGSDLQLFPVLWGLWRFYLIRSDLKGAHELAQEMLTLAGSAQDAVLLVEAHLAAGSTYDNTGDFESARNHFEKGISLYNPEQIDTHLLLYGHDPSVVLRCFNAWALWSLGYPDRALETAREALTLAEQLHHPETRCYALFFLAWTHQLRRESGDTFRYAEAAIKTANKNGIAQWIAFGSSLRGWALAEQGNTAEGITVMRQTLDLYRAIGSEISRPHFLGLLAEALIKTGETEKALEALDEALTVADSTGQRYYIAELKNLKGRLMWELANDLEQAEECFQQAIDLAQRQKAISFELRAATSLARLWQRTTLKVEARHLLAEVFNRFTDGFDTRDMVDARNLLDGLH